MFKKLIAIMLFAATGCVPAAPGTLSVGASYQHDGYGYGPSVYDQSHNGYGPVIVDAYTECWEYYHDWGGWGWYFDAVVDHAYGPAEIESVWVDVYGPYNSAHFRLHDGITLQYPVEAPGAEMYGFSTVPNDGLWMFSTKEMPPLDCYSGITYEVHTTAYDWEGNYQTVVQYI